MVILKNISKSYNVGKGLLPVLQNITLHVHKGEFAVVTGASGSGKSTLLNILGCLDNADSGEYYLDGELVTSLGSSKIAKIRNKHIGFVFQSFNLFPHMTVFENVALPMLYGDKSGKERKKRVEFLLQQVGLWDRRDHKPNELSGGQKQRTAIARALVNNPSLILADEPTGNLDSKTSHEIMGVLQKLNKSDNTIILITHETDIAAYGSVKYHLSDGIIC